MSKKRKLRRVGRPPDLNARRRQTTREGRAAAPLGPTPELLRRRLALTANQAGTDFPPDVLLAQGLITQDMRDEALRFAMLAWWLYGAPAASCAAIYERMVAEGFGGGDFAPRAEAETDEQHHARIRSQKARFGRMLAALGAVAPGPVESAMVAGKLVFYRARRYAQLKGSIFQAVRQAAQFLELPRLIEKLRDKAPIAPEDSHQMTLILEGLRRLVGARGAEDRHWRRRRAELVKELAAPVGESPMSENASSPTGRG